MLSCRQHFLLENRWLTWKKKETDINGEYAQRWCKYRVIISELIKPVATGLDCSDFWRTSVNDSASPTASALHIPQPMENNIGCHRFHSSQGCREAGLLKDCGSLREPGDPLSKLPYGTSIAKLSSKSTLTLLGNPYLIVLGETVHPSASSLTAAVPPPHLSPSHPKVSLLQLNSKDLILWSGWGGPCLFQAFHPQSVFLEEHVSPQYFYNEQLQDWHLWKILTSVRFRVIQKACAWCISWQKPLKEDNQICSRHFFLWKDPCYRQWFSNRV